MLFTFGIWNFNFMRSLEFSYVTSSFVSSFVTIGITYLVSEFYFRWVDKTSNTLSGKIARAVLTGSSQRAASNQSPTMINAEVHR